MLWFKIHIHCVHKLHHITQLNSDWNNESDGFRPDEMRKTCDFWLQHQRHWILWRTCWSWRMIWLGTCWSLRRTWFRSWLRDWFELAGLDLGLDFEHTGLDLKWKLNRLNESHFTRTTLTCFSPGSAQTRPSSCCRPGENNYFMKSPSNLLEQQKLLMYILHPDLFGVFNVCLIYPHH